jgi:hypothetical protein
MNQTFIKSAEIIEESLVVSVTDGRIISVPLTWYPRVLEASETAQKKFHLIGPGTGIHWDEIDEDVSLQGILAGIPAMRQKVA